ncbi:SigE family RNA polymerase sigma factor [Nocardioides jishulii]|uniref:SigE family RNA polymerase sigma factor n=1 Tax=Nocardioides jishulii TaxID=2575440 RepID=A0A4U2YME2_9ACTN|nr:SigE family RNA polymerase sigma factor [Nocardioides jishulii]QCX27278.1 SigE family RNA polymerase sigma factor [Nocardioides jishulii]TKI61765.1 SigE family RNA polymerase sigma factor [Nocardioides jishulii]
MPSRDIDEFAEFVAHRSPALHRTAYLMVGERGLAQDLLQEALTKTYVAWPRLRDRSRVEAYARKAITTTAISWYRKRAWSSERPAETLPDTAGDGHEAAVTERDWLWRALQELPPRQRAAIVCRFYDDLSEAATAEVMGCAVGTVKSQVSAGLRRLRSVLAEQGHSPELELPVLMETL